MFSMGGGKPEYLLFVMIISREIASVFVEFSLTIRSKDATMGSISYNTVVVVADRKTILNSTNLFIWHFHVVLVYPSTHFRHPVGEFWQVAQGD